MYAADAKHTTDNKDSINLMYGFTDIKDGNN